MAKQVELNHYDFEKYVSIERWNSYYYQIKKALNNQGNEILLIGVGDGIVSQILKLMGKNVTTLDFDENLNPDIIGSVTELSSIVKKKYDCIICCQVLEHLPFSEFENIIKQLKDCCNGKVILSLPYNRLKLFVSKNYLPVIHNIPLKILIPRFYQRKYRLEVEGWGEHYFEVGIKNLNKNKIRNVLKKYFNLLEEFTPIENVYHIFYILEVKNNE